MLAIIESGGKQYIIQKGQELKVEKLPEKEGDKLIFDKILFLIKNNKVEIGKPYLKDSTVEVKLTEQGRHKKIRILRYHSKTRHRKRKGHRQPYSKLKVTSIK